MSRAIELIHAVIGIIQRENKILLSRREPHQSYSGWWEFPGGKIEAHEAIETALRRELFEELGIEVIACLYCGQHTYAYPEREVQLEIYRITEFLHEPRGKEGQLLRWIALTELPQLNILDGSRHIIDHMLTNSGS